MTTLLITGDLDGERRCDAKCHNATEPRCRCCCAGRYHGRGGDDAIARLTRDLLDRRALGAPIDRPTLF